MSISITLNFNTIERAIAVLRGIPEADVTIATNPDATPQVEAPAPAPKPRATKPAPAPKVEAPAPSEPTAAAPAPAAPAEKALNYEEDVRPWALKLIAADPAAFTSVCAAFGVKNFKVLPADQFPAAVAAVKAKLEALEGV